MAIVLEPAGDSDNKTEGRGRKRRLIAAWLRRGRFYLLSRILVPVAIIPLHWLVRSWRARGPSEETLQQVAAAPRLVLITYHGMLLHLLAFAHVMRPYGRNLVLMVSPSLDGQLLAQVVKHFGLKPIYGSSRSQAVSASLDFVRNVKAGDLGVLAADGPRGPCCIAKPGFIRLAASIDSHLLLATTSAGAGIRFGSWDRSHLPLPFARVDLKLELLPPPSARKVDDELAAIQFAMLQSAREMRSPVLPRNLAKASHRLE
jgi:lysophospholipid acyltransferase (LPLAT)-like uncharacterized protein